MSFKIVLHHLVANWIRVGYCQEISIVTIVLLVVLHLIIPFGFIEMFDPKYQSWTGGGMHFFIFQSANSSFKNFKSFCSALKPLLNLKAEAFRRTRKIENNFSKIMQKKMKIMWAKKLGLDKFDVELFEI